MEVVSYLLPYTIAQPIRLYCIGDIHCGIKHCAESKVKDKVNEIKNDPNARWVGMGDYGEFITPSDPRWDVGVIADWLHPDNISYDLTKWIINLFQPIKDKCIGLLEGNHEDSIRTHSHVDVQNNICDELGVKNLGSTCMVRLIFKRRKSTESHITKGVFSHGAGWAITKGSKMNRLERFMNIFPSCQVAAIGHMHDIITHELPYLDIDEADNIVDRKRLGAVTGSWFKTYEQGVRASYGEKKGYPPTILGSPTFVFKPSTNKMWIE